MLVQIMENVHPICSESKKGGSGDGGTELNKEEICTNYSSSIGYCGNSQGYFSGIDCRSCAKIPTIIRVPIDIANNTFAIKTEKNNYIAVNNNGVLILSPSFKSETQELSFIFKLIPIDVEKDKYALQVFGNKYLSVQTDGTTQLRDKNYSWETFTIKGITHIPPEGGVALTDDTCTEFCSSNGYCGKSHLYASGGTDCTSCNKLDDNVVTISKEKYDTIGRAAKPMTPGQPCDIAGTLIKNSITRENAWVDVTGIKHVFSDKIWNTKDKSCGNNIIELSPDDYKSVREGDAMTTTDKCIPNYVSHDTQSKLRQLHKELEELAKKIIAEYEKKRGENKDTEREIVQKKAEFNTIMNNLKNDNNKLTSHTGDDITITGKRESSRVFASSNQLHLYVWLVVSIMIIWYTMQVVYGERTTIYDANKLTLFNKQNLILLVAIIWIIISVWKWRPKWMRKEWYTLPAWLR